MTSKQQLWYNDNCGGCSIFIQRNFHPLSSILCWPRLLLCTCISVAIRDVVDGVWGYALCTLCFLSFFFFSVYPLFFKVLAYILAMNVHDMNIYPPLCLYHIFPVFYDYNTYCHHWVPSEFIPSSLYDIYMYMHIVNIL